MFKKTALIAASVFAFAAPAFAQSTPVSSGPVTATARVKLWEPLEFTATNADLYFGAIVRESGFAATDLTMADDGTTDCASFSLTMTCSDNPTAASFELKADVDADVRITVGGAAGVYDATDNSLLLTRVGGTEDLKLDLELTGTDLTAVSGGDMDDYDIKGLGVTVAQPIAVHGVLHLEDSTDAPNGVYEADFTLTAEYI